MKEIKELTAIIEREGDGNVLSTFNKVVPIGREFNIWVPRGKEWQFS